MVNHDISLWQSLTNSVSCTYVTVRASARDCGKIVVVVAPLGIVGDVVVYVVVVVDVDAGVGAYSLRQQSLEL